MVFLLRFAEGFAVSRQSSVSVNGTTPQGYNVLHEGGTHLVPPLPNEGENGSAVVSQQLPVILSYLATLRVQLGR